MQGLMHGDRVRIEVRSDGQGRYIGQVLEVLERGVQAFLATVEAGRPRPERTLAPISAWGCTAR